MAKEEHCYVENIGGIDENIPSTSHVHMLFAICNGYKPLST
jgi:hypothetical protein